MRSLRPSRLFPTVFVFSHFRSSIWVLGIISPPGGVKQWVFPFLWYGASASVSLLLLGLVALAIKRPPPSHRPSYPIFLSCPLSLVLVLRLARVGEAAGRPARALAALVCVAHAPAPASAPATASAPTVAPATASAPTVAPSSATVTTVTAASASASVAEAARRATRALWKVCEGVI